MEQIQQELVNDIAELQVQFGGRVWVHELLPLLREMHQMTGETKIDAVRLADLRSRVETVLLTHKLKGFESYLWIIDDCLSKQISPRSTRKPGSPD